MNFKFMTWYYEKGVPIPRDFMFVLPVRSRHGFYGWKFSCWQDMPSKIDLEYSFTNIEQNKEWREKWKHQFGQKDPKLLPNHKRTMIKDLFRVIGQYESVVWE